MAKMQGAERFKKRLASLHSPAARARIRAALYVGADILRAEAALSIVHGAVQGKGHIASKPGEPPNRDTGQLDTSIHVREGQAGNDLRMEVVADAPHALPLELGTSKMEERPFMRPAAKKTAPRIRRLVQLAVNQIAREG